MPHEPTAMGREFYAFTLPKLIWTLEHIGAHLEKLVEQGEGKSADESTDANSAEV